MSQKDPRFDQLLPIELKLRILEAELERLESDFRRIEDRREQILREIRVCNTQLASEKRKMVLRRVK